MDYPVEIEGFEDRDIIVRSKGLIADSVLLIEGRLMEPDAKSGQIVARRNDGRHAKIRFKSPNPLDPVPQLIVDGRVLYVVEPFRWYHWMWMGLPLVLVLLGGLIGAVCGALAFIANIRVFRSHLLPFNKYVVTAGVTIASVILYELTFLLICIVFPGLGGCAAAP